MEATKSDLKNYLTWVAARLRGSLEMFPAECLTCFGEGTISSKPPSPALSVPAGLAPVLEICPACRGTKTREIEAQAIVLKMAEGLENSVKEFEKTPCPMLDSIQVMGGK